MRRLLPLLAGLLLAGTAIAQPAPDPASPPALPSRHMIVAPHPLAA